ncbi:hypothetical protein V6N13_025108 [Hibiscus sabdariffa]
MDTLLSSLSSVVVRSSLSSARIIVSPLKLYFVDATFTSTPPVNGGFRRNHHRLLRPFTSSTAPKFSIRVPADGETATNEANDCLLRKSDVVDGTEAADVEGSSDKAVVDGETTADEAGDCLLQESDVADGFLLE